MNERARRAEPPGQGAGVGRPPAHEAADASARYSLAEIDAQCRKAARGAGCPWGLAEEAGKAARWLAARGLPGPEALAGLLDGPRACPCGGGRGPDCALRIGASWSDRAETIASDGPERASVAQPLLVVAMLGRAAEATGMTFALEWNGATAVCGPDGFTLESAAASLAPDASILLRRVGNAPPPVPTDVRARAVDAAAWSSLERLASRTYAPATDASRRAGAGAGKSDND